MGWRLHRIWSVDWFRNPEEVIGATLRAVERAMSRGEPSAGVPAPPAPTTTPAGASASSSISAPLPVSPPALTSLRYPPGNPYQPAAGLYSRRELLLDPAEASQLADEIARVVAAETPIHPEVLLERLKDLHGVKRAGDNVRANFARALDRAIRSQRVRRDRKQFLWAPGQTLNTFRIPALAGESRKMEHIPVEEIRLAVLHLVESHFGVQRDAIVLETQKLLGTQRGSAAVQTIIAEAVDRLITDGDLRLNGNQLTLT
jgi:hypothetical protein